MAVAAARGECGAVLFETGCATPRDLIVQLSKLLPAALRPHAALCLFPLLHHVWQWRRPIAELHGLVLGTEFGLEELPPLPAGEQLWMEAKFHRGDDPPSSAEGEQAVAREAMEREQRMREHDDDDAVADLLVARATADGDGEQRLDWALQRAVEGREAAATAAAARGASCRRGDPAMVSESYVITI